MCDSSIFVANKSGREPSKIATDDSSNLPSDFLSKKNSIELGDEASGDRLQTSVWGKLLSWRRQH